MDLAGANDDMREFPPPNPLCRERLEASLKRDWPRLVLTADRLEAVKAEVKAGGPVADVYAKIRRQADALLGEPPLTRTLEGRRLLYVSRQVLGRTTALALAWLVDNNPVYLKRLEAELQAVCGFEDWNPAHFLDVAEMAVAVALPLDWCGRALDEQTTRLARAALREKALLPGVSGDKNVTWWIDAHHNWNLVCHGGLAIAALAVFEDDPELASRIVRRSVDKAPLGLAPYAPDGAYTEGPSYWFYATDYLTLTLSCYQTALGTDFGLAQAPGFGPSAIASVLSGGPSGKLFNYADSGKGGYLDFDHIGLLAWFVPRLRQRLPDWIMDRFPEALAAESLPIDRMSVFYMVNLLDMPADLPPFELPAAWVAGGPAPVGVLRPATEDGMYLAAKGGSADDNHAHMDAGSFILDWRGIRWSVDPGKLDYTAVEAAIGARGLWNRSQDSPRWNYLAHNNLGHSTLTVNGQTHLADARAPVAGADLEADQPFFAFDLKPLFGGSVGSARRTFRRIAEDALRIEDLITPNAETGSIRWQMMTVASVELLDDGAVLRKDGEQLRLAVRSPSAFAIRVVPLFPPPLPHDLEIPDLKRIEILVTPDALGDADGRIVVDLAGT